MPSLRELHEAATPAPWLPDSDHDGEFIRIPGATGDWINSLYSDHGEADAALIAAMRNALPLLLDVVDAARALSAGKQPDGSWRIGNLGNLADLEAALAALDGAA